MAVRLSSQQPELLAYYLAMRKKISVKSQVNRAHEGKGPFEKDRGQTYVIYIV